MRCAHCNATILRRLITAPYSTVETGVWVHAGTGDVLSHVGGLHYAETVTP